MFFGADFETDIGNSSSIRINCHCPLIRRSSSKGYTAEGVKMERKEVNAILVDDFADFLKANNLFQKFSIGNILCSKCEKSITTENIAIIYFDTEYRFCCDDNRCLEKL